MTLIIINFQSLSSIFRLKTMVESGLHLRTQERETCYRNLVANDNKNKNKKVELDHSNMEFIIDLVFIIKLFNAIKYFLYACIIILCFECLTFQLFK